MSVVTVFDKLRFEPEDVFLPAREQHGGEGSYGNGSAMRISPIALICKTEEELIKVGIFVNMDKPTLNERGLPLSAPL